MNLKEQNIFMAVELTPINIQMYPIMTGLVLRSPLTVDTVLIAQGNNY
jgi:hypothetical protein